jgi:hypothetical protein
MWKSYQSIRLNLHSHRQCNQEWLELHRDPSVCQGSSLSSYFLVPHPRYRHLTCDYHLAKASGVLSHRPEEEDWKIRHLSTRVPTVCLDFFRRRGGEFNPLNNELKKYTPKQGVAKKGLFFKGKLFPCIYCNSLWYLIKNVPLHQVPLV